MANGRKEIFGPEMRRSVGQTAYKRSLAYQRLGVDPEGVKPFPFFRTELRRIRRLVRPLRETNGSSLRAPVGLLDALQFSDDPEARKVVSAYLSVPASYRRLLPPEAFCQATGVSPPKVLEIIAGVEVRQGVQASAIVAVMVLPRVVDKTVERALQHDGFRERELIARVTGLLPRRS